MGRRGLQLVSQGLRALIFRHGISGVVLCVLNLFQIELGRSAYLEALCAGSLLREGTQVSTGNSKKFNLSICEL